MKECECQGVGHVPWCRVGKADDHSRIKRELKKIRRLLSEALDLGEEANGDESSCSYIVPVGDRLTEIRKEARIKSKEQP